MGEAKTFLAEALFQRGNELANLQRYSEAIPFYMDAMQQRPDHVQTRNNLAVMYAELRRFSEAIEHYEIAIQIDSNFGDAHYNLANALKELKCFDRAMAHYQEAIRCNPYFVSAYNNQAICAMDRGRMSEAVALFDRALQLSPHMAMAHNGRGLALSHLGRRSEAIHCFQKALALNPELAESHYNHGLGLLLQADFESGWKEYAWRWRLAENPPRFVDRPMWNGESLEGKTILIHAEQGNGDTLQFVRFAECLERLGARVVLLCRKSLHRLLASCRGIHEFVAIEDCTSMPDFDVHCALMDLGQFLVEDLDSIPRSIPYLHVEGSRVEMWRRELSHLAGCKVGICWQGSTGYRWDHLRSIPLSEWAPLGSVPGVQLVSLQKGYGSEQIGRVSFPVHDLTDRLDCGADAFVDTAALMQSLDLVISVDSAIGHLAGAMGIKAWIALPIGPDWRWHVGQDTSPWYPRTELFRQQTYGDWATVMEAIAKELAVVCTSSVLDWV
jgi:Flp pilus assembly protein TadD